MNTLELHHPHDAIAKECLSNLAIAQDFLEAHLPGAVKDLCDFSTLNVEPGSYVDAELKQYCSDILYSLKIDEGQAYIYCLVEHQSDAIKLMPFRILNYQVSIMRRHLDQGHEKLPLVIPLVLYHGKRKPYPYSLNLMDCFTHPKLARDVLFKELWLIDLSVIPEDTIMSHKRAALLEMVQKHIFSANIMEYIEPIKAVLGLIEQYPELQTTLRSVIYYLYKEANVPDQVSLMKVLTERPTPYQENAMTTAEYLIAEGMKKGIEQGMQQGMQEGEHITQLKIAHKLIEAGMNEATIKEITGIDLTLA